MAVISDPKKSSLLRAAPRLMQILRVLTRHGVHNPGEFFHLTRAFVIVESMIRKFDPSYDYIKAFREEISRLTLQHFSLERIKEKTGKFVLELEHLMIDAPGDTRRILRRIAEGNLGRLQVLPWRTWEVAPPAISGNFQGPSFLRHLWSPER